MSGPARSLPDVADELMRESENLIAVSTVSEVVLRLRRMGQATLSTLTEMARDELHALAAGISSPAASLASAGAAEFGPPPERA
jgi:hypothetical protein